jgi:hypothetical protein
MSARGGVHVTRDAGAKNKTIDRWGSAKGRRPLTMDQTNQSGCMGDPPWTPKGPSGATRDFKPWGRPRSGLCPSPEPDRCGVSLSRDTTRRHRLLLSSAESNPGGRKVPAREPLLLYRHPPVPFHKNIQGCRTLRDGLPVLACGPEPWGVRAGWEMPHLYPLRLIQASGPARTGPRP